MWIKKKHLAASCTSLNLSRGGINNYSTTIIGMQIFFHSDFNRFNRVGNFNPVMFLFMPINQQGKHIGFITFGLPISSIHYHNL